MPTLQRELIAEFVGTFILVFAGCGVIVANAVTDGAITHVGIALVWGAVVAALIYTLGHISGCHINPAVTVAFAAAGCFPPRKVIPFIVVQVLGAVAAAVVLRACFGNVASLGATLPREGLWLQSLVIEIALTFILMLVVLGSGLDKRSPAGFAGIAIGLAVGLDAMALGPITGASMNPARSFGPALVSGALAHHWIYWVAPIAGAMLAVVVYRLIGPEAFPPPQPAKAIPGYTHDVPAATH